MSEPPTYGEAWVFERLVGGLPGLALSDRGAVATQFLVLETAAIVVAVAYGLWNALLAGTLVIAVSAAGSAALLHIASLARRADPPEPYRRLLFGSSLEVLLAVVAYAALLTHLFVWQPRVAPPGALVEVLGPDPPAAAVFLALIVLWDVCYRIGTGWWAAVAALWRSARYRVDGETGRTLRRADRFTMAFGGLQLALVPLVVDTPVLFALLVGHVAAVFLVTGASLRLLGRGTATGP